jgi:hypothetical protein
MRVYVTKYWQAKGILQYDGAEVCATNSEMIQLQGTYGQYFHSGEWYSSYDDAVTRTKELIAAKRKSIAKEIHKLDNYDFTAKS